ncbi:SDR family NAD(P)-dependent oxidoreductase [Streptomyces vinaceus]|uniref:SDR family NAD(P)-dependent oxidoreductase n=1 Tax=Streptomyces vinaceus TaxID=1960 RepID=UPI0036A4B853
MTGTSRTVLITGTASGVGLAAAVAAARAGWRTVAMLRDPGRAGALRRAAAEAEVELDVRRLDVTDEACVAAAVDGVLTDYGRLDAVVNNAGARHAATLPGASVAEVRSSLEIGLLGVLNVTRAVVPHLRASGGRLITVTGVAGPYGRPVGERFCTAEFEGEEHRGGHAAATWARGVTVSVIEPGSGAAGVLGRIPLDPSDAVAPIVRALTALAPAAAH